MSQKHALPCPCGGTVPVESRQAGETTACEACGRLLDVPKLRELRQLNRIEESAPAARESSWSAWEGSLFVGGLLMLVIAAAASWYTYMIKIQYNVQPPDPSRIEFRRDMQDIPLLDSWQVWQQYSSKQIDTRPTPYHVLAREEVQRMDRWLNAFAVLAGLGALAVVSCFVLRLFRRTPHHRP